MLATETLLVSVMLLSAGAADAQEQPLSLAADATKIGVIDLLVAGPPGAVVKTAESSVGIMRALPTVVLNERGLGFIQRAALWRCDQRTRRFVALLQQPDGALRSTSFTVLTPSCRERLALTVARRASPGSRVRVTVRDTWKIGGVRPRLCVSPPVGRRRCRTAALRSGVARLSRSFRVSRIGRWRVQLHGTSQRLEATVHVGVKPAPGGRRRRGPRILLTGDSMIQTMDAVVSDRLRGRAQLRSEALAGIGLTKPGFDWIARARRQARRFRPRATVVWIGGNDAFAMRTPSRQVVHCCGEAWIDEYARRARAMMSAYAARGAGRVYWLTLPAPRSESRRAFNAAANEAMRRAARTSRHVRLVAFDHVFTPGFRYRDVMQVQGRAVRVRADDGIHLSVAGASIAASILIGALKADRVLTG